MTRGQIIADLIEDLVIAQIAHVVTYPESGAYSEVQAAKDAIVHFIDVEDKGHV